uniref:Histamine receptor H3 n=1 Tax=Petromyzon marinus TaxID=7757 RepID=S4R5B4_PETMA
PPDSGGLPNESGGAPGSAASQVHVAGGRGMAMLWPPGSSWTPGQKALLTALMVVLMLATVVGNALVILAFAVDRGLRTHANFFFLNLAIADLLAGAACTHAPSSKQGRMPLREGGTQLGLLNPIMICNGRVYFVLCIPVAVPQVSYRAQQCMTRRAVLKMLAVWLAAFLLYGPAIIAWEHVVGRSVVPQGECYAEFYYNWYFLIVASTFEFFTPLLSVAYFNLMIYSNIRRRRNTPRPDRPRESRGPESPEVGGGFSPAQAAREARGQRGSTPRHVDAPGALARGRSAVEGRRSSGEASSSAAASVASSAAGRVARLGTPRANVVGLCVNQEALSGLQRLEEKGRCADQRSLRLSRDKRVAKSLAIIVCVFAMCWTPYTLLMIIRAACRSQCVDDRLYEFSFWLLWLNSAVNPVLYPLCHVRFKRAFLRILCQRKFKVEP